MQIDASQQTGGEIATAWDLIKHGRAQGSDLTARFAGQAIVRSADRINAIAPSHVFPWTAIKPQLYWLAGLLIAGALVSGIAPLYAWTQVQRFLHPSSDTPPYSGITITLEQNHFEVRYGDELKILAQISRKPIERMELVTKGNDGRERVLPMLPRNGSKWQALLTQVTESSEFYVRSGKTRSDTGRLDVLMTPDIVDVTVRISPPEYTHQAIYEGKIPEAGIAGIAGTRVEFFVTSNRPLQSGLLQLDGNDRKSQQVELAVDTTEKKDPFLVTCELEIRRDAKFELTVTDVDGLTSSQSVTGKLELLVDQRPVVRITDPRPLSLATPDIDMRVAISAEDDFGITQLRLYRSLNGSPARPVDLAIDGGARINGVVVLPLPRFGLSPGDEIDLFARTEDNDPAGAKGAESPKTTIRIISVAEFQERMLEQRGAEAVSAKYEAAQRHLENVSTAIAELQEAAERAAANPENNELQEDLQAKLEATQKAAEKAANEIQKLSENPMDIDIDRELTQMLRELAQETATKAQSMAEMTRDQAGERPLTDQEKQSIEQWREEISGMREQIQEEAIDPLNELSKAIPLMEAKERFDELVEQQSELANRMQSLADADPGDPSNERRMMEMEAMQDQLRQELSELAQSLADNADQLPATPDFEPLARSAKGLAEGIEQSGAPELMNDAQKSLLRSKYAQAAENAKGAAEALQSLFPQNESMGQEAGDRAEGAFDKPAKNGGKGKGKDGDGKSKLGNTLDQLKRRMGKKGGKGQQSGEGEEGEPGGKNNGFSQRSSRPSNLGMYGSMPSPAQSSQGRSDKVSQGAATRSEIAKQNTGSGGTNESQTSDASGQSQQSIPSQYRQRVSEYYRRINENLKPE
jgi:hypothetical protein